MKQKDLINELKRNAELTGSTLNIHKSRGGITAESGGRRVNLGPDRRKDYQPRDIARYCRQLAPGGSHA